MVVDRYREGKARRIFATIMPLVALSPRVGTADGCLAAEPDKLAHDLRRAIGLRHPATATSITAEELKKSNRPENAAGQSNSSVSFWQLFKSPVFSGNVAMFAAGSAGFFAWLTGSPFILSDMGYSPNDIGLSYMPQTLAFLWGGVMATVPH